MSEFTEADRRHAVMQGAQNQAVDEYIDARPQLDTIHNRRILEAGFARGWEAANELNAFKTYVHQRLDEMGVPYSIPESEHDKAGCRVGGRLDWVEQHLTASCASLVKVVAISDRKHDAWDEARAALAEAEAARK